MTWREDLRRVDFDGKKLIGASFRGVPFFVETSERTGGRRTVTHDFPLSDESYTEDLGRAVRSFHLEGYLLGDDYLAQRDKLLAACEDEDGPGQLVDPYYGEFTAICTVTSTRQSRAEGGFATVSLQFTRTPSKPPAPTVVVDTKAAVETSAAAASIAMDAELVTVFQTSGLPSWSFASAETALRNALRAVQDFLGPIADTAQEAATLNGQLALMTAEAASLVRQPADAIDGLRDAIEDLVGTAAAVPNAMIDALTDAYAADLGAAVDALTPTRARELANQVALIAAIRRVFAIEAARLAPTAAYKTIEDALEARDRIVAMLDEQAGISDDDAYPAIVDLRAQLMRAVPGGQQFASVVTVSRRAPVPSLVLAYQLYGAVDLELDVVARNSIRNPGFCVGDLKVLSDG